MSNKNIKFKNTDVSNSINKYRILMIVFITAAVCVLSAGIGTAEDVDITLKKYMIGDISNSAAPTPAGRYDTAGYAQGVAVLGSYAYVADDNNGLVIVDISDPTMPIFAGSYDTAGYALGVAVSGSYAYVADSDNGLVIVDISDPTAPILAGSYNAAVYAEDVAVSGSYAYVTDFNNGLMIFDISNPVAPTLAGSYNTAGFGLGVAVSGSYAYVAGEYTGLVIVDISDPAAPTLAGLYDIGGLGLALDVAVSGNYAYVADDEEGFVIVDISNPAIPILAGSYNTAGYAYGIAVSGNYAYVADTDNGLVIIGISDPAAPTYEGSIDTAGTALDVAVSGSYAYVADDYNGLVILRTNIASSNNAPVASDQSVTTPEDISVDITLSATDADGDALTYSIVDVASHGTVTLSGNTATYTPDANYNGADSFTFKANDGTVDSNTATVSMTVTGVNNAPVADDQSATTPEDTLVDITLSATDADGDALTYSIVDVSSNGTVTLSGNTATYTPDANYNGADSFTFKANDGTVDSNTATVSMTVTGVNNAPVADDQSATTPEDTSVDITLSATDADGDSLTYSIVDVSSNGTITLSGNTATYTPDANYNGADSFTFKANDGTVDSNTATVSITVAGVNDVPVADPNGPYTGTEGIPVTFDGSVSYDPDGTIDSYDWDFGDENIGSGVDPSHTYAQDGIYTVTLKVTDNDGATDLNSTTVVVGNIAPTVNITLEGHFGGETYTTAVSGNYAYVGQGQDLVVLDISNPSQPLELGRIHTLGLVYDIKISGNYAYVADKYNGLVIVDISNPATPTLVGSYDTGGWAYSVVVSSSYAYVADENNGLVIVDVNNPAAPTLAGSYDTAGYARGVAVSGSYAYVADYHNVVIVNISNPAAPTYVGTYNAGTAWGVAVSGSYAYVADGNKGLMIVNISNPAAPTYVGNYNTAGSAYSVAVSGNYAYVADKYNGLVIVDISNPAAPTLAGSYNTAGSAYSVAVSGSYAYVSDGDNGLVIVDISDPAIPTLIGSYDTVGDAYGIAVSGSYAYVAGYANGLVIVDINDPAAPTLAGSYDAAGVAQGVAVSGSYAYVADWSDGLVIVDINNPAAPTLAGSYDTAGHAHSVAVSGSYAYVADGDNGLVIVDISNPAAPTLAGSYNTAGYARGVTVSGSYAYVADFPNGLVIIDISDLAAPTFAGSYDTAGDAWGVAVSGSYAYVADESNGLVIIDISDPAAPTFAGSYDTAGDAWGVAVSGSYAYVADRYAGLVIVDVSNPAATTLADSYDTAGDAYGVAASGSYAYVAEFNNGLVILHTNIAGSNNAPVASDQSVTTPEDTSVDITLSATDVDGDTLTYSIVDDPSNGTVTLSGNTATYTPDANYNGADSFTFKANDGTDDSNTATVSITVSGVNNAPVASDQSVTTPEDTSVDITLSATDADGDPLTYSIVDAPSNGTVTLSGNTATYTPDANYNGADSFTFKANDGIVDSNTATVSITVTGVNNAPVASDQSVTTPEDTSVDITLSATDVDGDTLTYSIVDDPSNGTVTLSGNTATYTPDANYNGADSFTFKANDGTDDSNTATVSITVSGVNNAPVASDQSVTTPEDTSVDITLSATDADGDPLTYSIVDAPSNGTVTLSGNTATYTPDANYNGADSFTFKANDGIVDSNTATVSITVTGVNNAPVASDQSVTTPEDTSVNITLSATDADGDTLTYSIVDDPSNGTVTLSGNTATYTPDANYNGADSFTFKANDGTDDSNTATVSIIVTGVNNAPVASDQSVTTPEDTSVDITLSATDADGDPLTYSIVDAPSNGTVTLSGNTATYTPDANYNGADSFTFKANDGIVDSNTATVSITVTGVNNAPVASDQSVTTPEDTSVNITLSATDADGDTLTYSIVDDPSNGTVTLSGNTATYTPDANYNGADSFIFKANDGTDDSNTATVSIIVTGVNNAPVASDQSVTTPEDTSVDITLSATDADGDTLTYSIVNVPSNGTVTLSGNTATYTPDANYNGADSFTFKANDGIVDSNTATVSITVTGVNNAPVASDQSVTTPEDTSVNITLSATDADGDSLTYSIVNVSSNGTVTLSGNTATYTPDANYSGADSFTFKANDGTDNSNTATVSITVTGVNNVPVADPNGPYTGTEGIPVTFDGSGSYDPDGSIDLYNWDFGDENSGSGVNPSHTYTQDGIYTVNLTVTDNDGATDSNSTTVVVGNIALTVTIHSPPSVTNDSTPQLYATFDQMAALTWYVIDGAAGTGGSNTDNLTVTLPELADGQHTVTVYANNSDGNVGSATQDFIVDTIAPNITIDNTPTGTDVPVTTVITLTFDESMNTASVEGTFSIDPSVTGTFNWSGDTMTFTTSANLAYSTTHEVTIGTGAEDLAGNSLATAYIWDFTTEAGSEPDTIAPTVIGNIPTGTNVPVTTVITITFDESMNTTSVEDAFSTNPSVTGTFNWDGDTVTFTPSADLAYSTMYEVTIETGAEDLAGNPLATAYIWEFTTKVVPTSNNIIQNPGFESGTDPWIFYTSETGTFSMASPGYEGNNAAKLALNSGGKNIQLYQTGVTLEPDTRYWLSFSAKSNTGHDVNVRSIKHVSPYTNYGLDFTADLDTNWQTFTTEFTTTGFTGIVNDGRLMFWLAPFAASGDTYFIDGVRLEKVDIQDTTPPTVAGNGPTGTNVPVSTQIHVTFSEVMDQASAELAFLTSPETTGSFRWNGNIMTYTPDSDLTSDTTYTVTIGTGAMDLPDNNMLVEHTWQFTTEIVQNPGFESGTSPWRFYTNGIGTFLNDASGDGSPHAGHITISQEGSNVQLYQSGIVLEPNTLYRLSFKAYSNTGHDFSISLHEHGSPYTNYGLSNYVVDLGTSWSEYSTQFTTSGFSGTVNDGRLRFWLSPYDATGDQYFIDDIRLVEVDIQDTTPPTIIGNEPTGTDVTVSTQIHVTFSEAMDQASAESAFSTSPVTTGNFSWNSNIMTYIPDLDLASDTTYTVTVGTGAKDLADNNMLVEHTWNFTTEVTSNNIILNPGFESGTSPWRFYTNGIGTFLNDASGDGSPHAGHITISQEGSNVQLYQPGLVLEPNTLYRLSFKAYSNTGHEFSISLHEHGSPYTNYGLSDYVVNLGTSWSEYSTQFTTSGFSGTVNDGRLRFWLSPYDAIGDQYFIDDVILEKV